MARTVYSGSRTFECEVLARSFARDRSKYPYALFIFGQRQYAKEEIEGGSRWRYQGKAVCMVESDYPIYVQRVLVNERDQGYINTFGHLVSGKIVQNTRISARMPFTYTYQLQPSDPPPPVEEMVLSCNVFSQCTVGPLSGNPGNLDCSSDRHPEWFSRLKGCMSVNNQMGRTFTDSGNYSTSNFQYYLSSDCVCPGSVSGHAEFTVYQRYYITDNDESTIRYSNTENPTFSSGEEWLAWCRSH